MRLKNLRLKDKALVDRFLKGAPHQLSTYAFENIYIWKNLFDIRWLIIEDSLCVFFKDRIGTFLYFPPITEQADAVKNPGAVKEAFEILCRLNSNKDFAHIENIECPDAGFFRRMGYRCEVKTREYLYLRSSLAGLKGGGFKSKRSGINYFIKHYKFEYLPFSSKYKNNCLALYDQWARERQSRCRDIFYQSMLRDSRSCLGALLKSYSGLDLSGGIVKIGGRVKAFTLGFPLNRDIFCVLFEIADLSIKGLAQFIFQHFCGGLSGYKYINAMDDSGLENLRRVKLSYRPFELAPSYIARK